MAAQTFTLWVQLQVAWSKIGPETLGKWFERMLKLRQAVIKGKCGYIDKTTIETNLREHLLKCFKVIPFDALSLSYITVQ